MTRWYIDARPGRYADPFCRVREEKRPGIPDPEIDRLVASCPDAETAARIVRDHNHFPGPSPTAGRGSLQPRPAIYSDEVKQ